MEVSRMRTALLYEHLFTPIRSETKKIRMTSLNLQHYWMRLVVAMQTPVVAEYNHLMGAKGN